MMSESVLSCEKVIECFLSPLLSLQNYPFQIEAILHVASELSFYNRIPVIIYLLIILAIGAVGNTLVLLVYGLCFPHNSTRVFVLSIAICDLITNVIGIPFQLITVRYAYDIQDLWLCRSFFFFISLPPQTSGVMLVLVAIDRYRKICTPLAKQFTSRKAWMLTLLSVGGSTIVFAPFIPLYGLHRVPIGFIHGGHASMCWNEAAHMDQPYRIVVMVVFMSELLVMGLAYLLIVRTIWKQTRKRQAAEQYRLTSHDQGRVDGTKGQSGSQSQGNDPKGTARETAGGESLAAKDAENPHTFQDMSIELVTKRGKKIRNRTTCMMATLTLLHVLNWLPHGIMRFQYLPASNWCDNLIDCDWTTNVKAILIRSLYINSAVNALVYSCNAHFFAAKVVCSFIPFSRGKGADGAEADGSEPTKFQGLLWAMLKAWPTRTSGTPG